MIEKNHSISLGNRLTLGRGLLGRGLLGRGLLGGGLRMGLVAACCGIWSITPGGASEVHLASTNLPPNRGAADEPDAKPQDRPQSADWPSFRNGNQQTGVATSKLPEKLELLWKINSQDGFVAAVAIVGERVYAGTLSGDLLCLDLASGKTIWKYRSIDNPDPKEFAPGLKAAPRVTHSMVFVGDEDGVFHAVDRRTGKRKWKLQTDAEIAGCAAVVGNHVIIGSHDSFLYCLDHDSGSVVWKFQTDDRINCSPAIAGKFTFVAGCDEHLRVINIETGKQRSDIPLDTYLIASPAVSGNMLYVGTYASEVVAINWKDEEIEWKYKDPKREFPYHSSAAVNEEFVIVGGQDKQLHCMRRANGKRVWAFPTRAQVNSSPVIVGQRVFFGSNDGNVYGLKISDGKLSWKYNVGKDISASPAVGQGRLLIGAEGQNGALYCFGAK